MSDTPESTETPAAPLKRRRGGQPGNKNRLLHGFYSPLFTDDEKARLDDNPSIDDELKLLRTRVLRLASQVGFGQEFDQKMTRSLLDMIQTIASLERIKALTRGRGGEIGESILNALAYLDPYKEL